MPVSLRWLDATTLPVDAEGITPQAVRGLTPLEVSRLRVRAGNRGAELGELFAVNGSEDALRLEGDMPNVHGIGRGMSSGALTVHGRTGAYLGAGLSGGTIEVHGNVAEWAGVGMSGGIIRVHGEAGDGLGGALPGSRLGMRDGVIVVHDRAGSDVGRRMRRGLIAVAGPAGDGFGADMIAGTVVACGPVGRDVGAGMKRGSIVLCDAASPRLPVAFERAGRFRFPFLAVYFRHLASLGFAVPLGVSEGSFARYNGDLASGGQGEILTSPDAAEG